jgi:ABC-type transporter lipoprotein component MlaA
MKNKKFLLSYVAIPLFGVGSLVTSCEFDTYNKPQTYYLKVSDVNKDGLKDLIIRDSKGDIEEIFVQKNDGKYISVREAYRLEKLKKIHQYLEEKAADPENKKDDDIPLLLNPAFTPYFFPKSP